MASSYQGHEDCQILRWDHGLRRKVGGLHVGRAGNDRTARERKNSDSHYYETVFLTFGQTSCLDKIKGNLLYCTGQIARAYILLGFISFLLIAILSRLYFSSVACCMGRRSLSRYFRYEISFFNRGPNNKSLQSAFLGLYSGIKQIVRLNCLSEIGLICNGFFFASNVLPSS